MVVKKKIIKRKVATKKKVGIKKAVTKKRTLKKSIAVESIPLTKEHQKSIDSKIKLETALGKAKESLSKAQANAKKTATEIAKKRLASWMSKVTEATAKVKDIQVEIAQHEKTARELATMEIAKVKAIAAFASKWEREYFKKLALKKKNIKKAAQERARVKKAKSED